jgi:Flp pilus assembly CpaE family ATPase
MMVNVVIDFVIGLVPGAEAVYRGNTRNALLLEDYLREKAEKSLQKMDQMPDQTSMARNQRDRRGMRREESGA